MTYAVAALNFLLGFAYSGYGVMTAIELRRDRHRFGFSHFGLAWIFMAFTCGPHHLDRGLHVVLAGSPGGWAELVAVVVGIPAGVLWLWLRVEAFAGGQGDRFISGTPLWLRALPVLTLAYLAVLGAAMTRLLQVVATFGTSTIWVNVSLIATYMAIGWFLLRTQLRNHSMVGGWSVSGLCLTVVFPTCALMHAVFATYLAAGLYASALHISLIDWMSLPASLYFLWVVRGLYRQAGRDWNVVPSDSAPVLSRP